MPLELEIELPANKRSKKAKVLVKDGGETLLTDRGDLSDLMVRQRMAARLAEKLLKRKPPLKPKPTANALETELTKAWSAIEDAKPNQDEHPPLNETVCDRVQNTLAAEGAEGLYRDEDLLRQLAIEAVECPATWSAVQEMVKKSGGSVRNLDRALKPLVQQLRDERQQAVGPTLAKAAGYQEVDGSICWLKPTRDGEALVPLCNFAARITEVVTRDDGVEQTSHFTISGRRSTGQELRPVLVPAADFAGLGWITTAWHGDAVRYAGQGTCDHLRAAIELLSPERARRTVYAHLGWRRIGDRWFYLHGGGAIDLDGPVSDIEVELPGPLAGFALPEPPQGVALVAAVRASLALLDDLAPDRIAFPLSAAVYRAALGEMPGPIDLSLYLAGPHAAGKTEQAALRQQHFGAGLDARHLPGSWSSTANALEGLAFTAKDALLVVDDYAPRGAMGDRQRLERDADRLLRGQGNRAGRQRMRSDGSLRPDRPPRGLILSTGEDIPSGQSLRGRMLVLEVSPGDVPFPALTRHQQAGASGQFAAAMAGFVCWLASQYDDLRERLPGERAEFRDRALKEITAGSGRTPGIVADLALGMRLFFDFARTAGAITSAERASLAKRGWAALLEAATAQAEHVHAAEPTALFLRLLTAALASGRAHVANPTGFQPTRPEAWGWRGKEFSVDGGAGSDTAYQAQGKRIGWLEDSDLYLEPEAAYAAAQEMARDQGEAFPISSQTLRKRLKERGLLASVDDRRQRNTVRRTLEGVKVREVLHLHADSISPAREPAIPSIPSTGEGGDDATSFCADGLGDDPVDGFGDGFDASAQEPSTETVHEHGQNGVGGRNGRFSTGRDTPLAPKSTTSCAGAEPPSPPPGARLHFTDAQDRPCAAGNAAKWCWEGGPCWYDASQHPVPIFPAGAGVHAGKPSTPSTPSTGKPEL
jgi:hypothetical protein